MRGLLNSTYALNSTKGNNSKIKLKTCRTIVSKYLDENSGHLHIDKLTFPHITCYFTIACKWEGQRYITSYYKKISTMIMQMYRTKKFKTPEYFNIN